MAPPLPLVPPGRQPTSKAANHPSGSVRARRRARPCMSPLWLEAVPQSMFSIMPRSRQGALTTGLRPQYHTTYYAAFVLDPDGNNIEVVCDGPE